MSNFTPPPPDTSVKIPHLVFGLLFLGLTSVWALVAGGAIDVDRVAVLGPALLIAAGVIGLVASVAASRNRSRGQREYLDRATGQDMDAEDHLDLFGDTEETREIR